MNKRNSVGRATSVLLLLATLIVGVTILAPVAATAADPAGITDFSYQTLSGATLSDSSTDLRFLFKIDSLDYEKVGFVFSKSDSTPTIGEEHCGVYETTSAYSAINAGGDPQSAGENHWWVAVKLAGIPKANFGATVYVVGFVKAEGEDPVYTDVRTLSACAALGHDYEWTTNADTHAGTCSVCGDEVAESGHNFSMSVSGNVATYTCLGCGYSFDTNLVTNSGAAIPSGNREGNTETISQTAYDSDDDGNNDCLRVTMTDTGKKYWLNYSNSNPTYADGKTHVLSFKIDIRFASGAVPTADESKNLFYYYTSFSGNASGGNDQGYGFRAREYDGRIRLTAFSKDNFSTPANPPTFNVWLDYDEWYTLRTDVVVSTSGSTNTLQAIKVYVNDKLVHTVNLATLKKDENTPYSSFSTENKVRQMFTGISGATVTFDIKNIGTYVGVLAD